MKGKTHAITAAFITTAVLKLPMEVTSIPIIMAGTIGALVPDIDITNSKITHMITHNNSNNILIQNLLKFIILNLLGLIGCLFYSKNIYPLLLSAFLSILSLTEHRTLSHSLLSLGIVVWLVSMIIPNKQIAIAVGLGYLIHLLEDMLNVTGTPLLYPIIIKKQRIPIITNKVAEFVFCVITSSACLLVILKTLSI